MTDRPSVLILSLGLLLAVNVWGVLMWRGSIGRQRITDQASRESWGTNLSPSYLTTSAPAWAIGWDLLLISSLVAPALGSDGRDTVAALTIGPAIVAWGIGFAVAGWDRPRWALPPWYREWKAMHNARGHDANHPVSVVCVQPEDRSYEPYVFAQCACDWMTATHAVADDDFAGAIRATIRESEQHSRNLRPAIEFPLERPTRAPRELPP